MPGWGNFPFRCFAYGLLVAASSPYVYAEENSCDLDTGSVNLCGQEVTYKKFCPAGPPPVTAGMLVEAANHPELSGKEGTFACVSVPDGAGCKAHDTREGDAAFEASMDDFARAHDDQAAKERFHAFVTDVPLNDIRDDGASLASRGFSREVNRTELLYRIDEHAHFHGHAEGVNLVEATLSEKEKTAQLALADTLDEMQAKFAAAKDEESAKATGLYAELARSRASLMDALVCDLKQKADIDNDRENRMHSLTELAYGSSTATGTSTATHLGNNSDVTGSGSATVTSAETSGATSTSTSTETTTSAATAINPRQSEILASFNTVQFQLVESPGDDLDTSLFVRVHAKLQQREAKGQFYKTIVDEE
ncbi:MAG: hypothetical protein ACXWSC_16870, partial [Bdellovibrionota bacterium]